MMHRGLELYAQAGIRNLLLLDGNPLEDISAVRRGDEGGCAVPARMSYTGRWA